MISLIIPAYNEEKIIGDTVRSIQSFMQDNFTGVGYEVIFVDDGSKDGTLKIINEFINGIGSIKAISYEKNKGKGGAVRTGVLASSGDLVFYTDSDLAYGLGVIKSKHGKRQRKNAERNIKDKKKNKKIRDIKTPAAYAVCRAL